MSVSLDASFSAAASSLPGFLPKPYSVRTKPPDADRPVGKMLGYGLMCFCQVSIASRVTKNRIQVPAVSSSTDKSSNMSLTALGAMLLAVSQEARASQRLRLRHGLSAPGPFRRTCAV